MPSDTARVHFTLSDKGTYITLCMYIVNDQIHAVLIHNTYLVDILFYVQDIMFYVRLQPPVPQGSLPQNAAITVASLQATSNLLQQAIAMASAQMAATNNPQVQQVHVCTEVA